MFDYYSNYSELLKFLESRSPFRPDMMLILGSGLGDLAESLNIIESIDSGSLRKFPQGSVEGHKGNILFAEQSGHRLLVFQGRIHFYEGFKLYECLLPVFISGYLGCSSVLLTNAAGGISDFLTPGDLMLISGFNNMHIKKEFSQLISISSSERLSLINDFPSEEISETLYRAAEKVKIALRTGTYMYVKGPNYETPAEIRMIKKLCCDAVGMSTAHEAAFAASLGMKVGAVSCITNMASGISKTRLSHKEVIETGILVKKKYSSLIKTFFSLLRPQHFQH